MLYIPTNPRVYIYYGLGRRVLADSFFAIHVEDLYYIAQLIREGILVLITSVCRFCNICRGYILCYLTHYMFKTKDSCGMIGVLCILH